MGLIAQNMKCEIPSVIKLTAQKRTVKYLTAVPVEWSRAKGKLFICEGAEQEENASLRD